MEQNIIEILAQQLRKQRRHHLEEFRKAEEYLASIAAERETELEEHAQEEQSARVLAYLDDRTLQAIHEVDAALERILRGVYGICEGCGHYIAVGRLEALPASRRCTECEERNEKHTITPMEEPETASAPAVPADLSLLGDAELVESIREHLKEDGRIDTEELRIACRKSVVYLTGAVPSQAAPDPAEDYHRCSWSHQHRRSNPSGRAAMGAGRSLQGNPAGAARCRARFAWN